MNGWIVWMNIDCLNTKNSARPNCGRNSFSLKWNPILSFRFAHETMLLCCIVGILFANAGTLVLLHTHTHTAHAVDEFHRENWNWDRTTMVWPIKFSRLSNGESWTATASDEMKILFEKAKRRKCVLRCRVNPLHWLNDHWSSTPTAIKCIRAHLKWTTHTENTKSADVSKPRLPRSNYLIAFIFDYIILLIGGRCAVPSPAYQRIVTNSPHCFCDHWSLTTWHVHLSSNVCRIPFSIVVSA